MISARAASLARSVLGKQHGLSIPVVVVVDASEVPATGPSFGVNRLKDETVQVGTPPGDLRDAVLVREVLLQGFSPQARRKGFVLHACNWVAWRLATGKGTRAAYWDAWASDLVATVAKLSIAAAPPTLLAEISRLGAPPLAVYAALRDRVAGAEALAGRIHDMDTLADWARHVPTTFLPVPTAGQVDAWLAATRLFLQDKTPPTRPAIEAASPGTTAVELTALMPWLVFLHNVNVGYLDTRYVLVACTSPRPASELDTLLSVPGMLVRHSIVRGALAGGEPRQWHSSLLVYAVPSGVLGAFGRFLDILAAAGLFTTIDTWVMDQTTTAVNANQHDPAGPAFTFDTTIVDDPTRVVASTVDYQAGILRAREHLAGLRVHEPATYVKFLEALSSPFRLGRQRYGAHVSRLATLLDTSLPTIKTWLETRATITVPHPRTLLHFMPYHPAFSTIIAITPPFPSRKARHAMAAPFLSWQASTSHRLGQGRDVEAWFLRVPDHHVARAFNHVAATAPGAACGLVLVQEVGLKQATFLPWFDFDARTHVDTAPVLGTLAASAREVLERTTTLAGHEAVVRRVAAEMPAR